MIKASRVSSCKSPLRKAFCRIINKPGITKIAASRRRLGSVRCIITSSKATNTAMRPM